jgi:hypothetical protein
MAQYVRFSQWTSSSGYLSLEEYEEQETSVDVNATQSAVQYTFPFAIANLRLHSGPAFSCRLAHHRKLSRYLFRQLAISLGLPYRRLAIKAIR